jgi:hypothetical protein
MRLDSSRICVTRWPSAIAPYWSSINVSETFSPFATRVLPREGAASFNRVEPLESLLLSQSFLLQNRTRGKSDSFRGERLLESTGDIEGVETAGEVVDPIHFLRDSNESLPPHLIVIYATKMNKSTHLTPFISD